MNKKCPCIDCICVAICSGKTFSNLMGSCKLVSDYYYFSSLENFESRLENIVKIINPVWEKQTNFKIEEKRRLLMAWDWEELKKT